MSFTEKINVIIDVTTDKASAGLKGFKSAVADAEGFTGKLKAGASSLGDTLAKNAGPALIAAGTAAVAFGVKAVGAFTDTAKAAIDLSAATGLSTEAASRWIAVGDDMGVTAESLTSGIGKIAKTLDDSKWAEYGIATRDAAGNARDANDILLDAFDVLGKTTNETERARIGNELFGKGYASLAPLVGKTREEYEQMLGSVEAGQVITGKEAEKAERMRKAQDALQDALREVTLAVGQFASSIGPMVQGVADGIEYVTELESKLGLLEKTMWVTNPAVAAYETVQSNMADTLDLTTISLDDLTKKLTENGFSTEQITAITAKWYEIHGKTADEIQRSTGQFPDYVKQLEASGRATKAVADAEREADEAIRHKNDAIRAGIDANFAAYEASNQYKQAVDDMTAATDDAKTSINEQEAATVAAAQAAINLASQNVALAEKQAEASGAAMTAKEKQDLMIGSLQMTAAELAPGSPLRAQLEQYIALLAGIPANVNTNFTKNGVSFAVKPGTKQATGTSWAAGGATLVGEQGPEIVNMPRGAEVIPAGPTARLLNAGGGGMTVVNQVNNIRTTADYRQLQRALQLSKRRGATSPW